MPLTLRDIKNSDGLIRYSRPIPWPVSTPVTPASRLALEYVYNPSYVPNASSQAVRGFNAVAANNVVKVARPYPFTALSRTVGLERAAALRGGGATVATKALEGTVRSGRVATLLRPVTGAAARFGGAIERLPVVGRVLTKVPILGKLTGPLLIVSTITSIVDIMQSQAPGVQGWLLGGWRNSLRKGLALPPGVGQSAVPYRITVVIENQYLDGHWDIAPFQPDFALNVPGPISEFVEPRTARSGAAFAVYSPAGLRVGVGHVGYGNGTYRFKSISITRMDGVPETGTPWPSTSTKAPPTTQKLAPVNSPGLTDNAQNARDAALLLAAATIAAGKLQPTIRRSPFPKNNRRIAPIGDPIKPKPVTGTGTQPCKGNQCGQATLDQAEKNGEDIQKLLDYLNLLGIGDIKKTVDRIDQKVGPQLYDDRGNKTGLAGAAIKTFEKINKVGDYLHLDRVLNVLTFATTVHNATMLSNNLVQTLEYAVSNVLAAVGIKDAENNPLDIQKIVNRTVEDLLKGAVGAENYTVLKTEWKKANRIYQASANLLNNLQSLRYSITGALDTIGSMNAKVGNALKKYGVLGDNAYPWFNPSPNFDNKYMRSLETVEQVVSNIDSVASEVLSAQETVTEIGKQKTELETAIKAGTEKPGVDNDQQKAKAAAAKTASKSPDLNSSDFVKPES
jgi:hypothetical protein